MLSLKIFPDQHVNVVLSVIVLLISTNAVHAGNRNFLLKADLCSYFSTTTNLRIRLFADKKLQ